jgi:hypothetical protein
MTTYEGFVQNGQIHLDGDEHLPEGARVIVTLVGDDPGEVRGITGEELLAAPFIGVWADRDDIGDTAEFAEELRRRWQSRD